MGGRLEDGSMGTRKGHEWETDRLTDPCSWLLGDFTLDAQLCGDDRRRHARGTELAREGLGLWLCGLKRSPAWPSSQSLSHKAHEYD